MIAFKRRLPKQYELADMSLIQLIVGLSNPGKEYAATRHNAGAWFVEKIAKDVQINLMAEPKFHGFYAQKNIDQHHCHFLIPTTFMNASGQSVSSCMRYRKIPTNAVLIAHDDIDLPVGTIKLKFDGGDGGHNGLKDIIRHLHTKQFYRLRIGVGRPRHSKDMIDFVLHPPSKSEKTKIMLAIEEAQSILPLLLAGEIQKAMQRLHTPLKDA